MAGIAVLDHQRHKGQQDQPEDRQEGRARISSPPEKAVGSEDQHNDQP